MTARAPLRARLFSAFVRSGVRGSVATLPPQQFAAARQRQRRLTRLPGASLLVGGLAPGCVVQQQIARLPGRDLRLRIYRPVGLGALLPVIVNYHGGGWCLGDARQSEWWASHVAVGVGAAVVSVEYRLAPEHPFPAAADDCYAAALWVAEHAERLAVDADRLAVMGDSAGGNLAAVVSLMARELGAPRVRHQVLIYPAVDIVGTYASERENADAPMLNVAERDAYLRHYVSGHDGTTPFLSPLRAQSHAGLPPTLVQTARFDMLRDQGRAYADALTAAGVPVRHTEYVDGVHGFISVPGVAPCARQALVEVIDALRPSLMPRREPTVDRGR